MTKAMYHLLWRDFDALVSEDAIALGFLPADYDTTPLRPLVTKILTVAVTNDDIRARTSRPRIRGGPLRSRA